jgi:methylthioribose-1-phosphate isomerase
MLTLSIFQLYTAEKEESRTTASLASCISMLNGQITLAKTIQSATSILATLDELHGEEKEKFDKASSELEVNIAQLTKKRSTLVAAEQTMQRMQQFIDTKETTPSFQPSSEEKKQVEADLAKTIRALQELLPEEERGETQEKVDYLLLKLTKESD